jgi:hypothetical protein
MMTQLSLLDWKLYRVCVWLKERQNPLLQVLSSVTL